MRARCLDPGAARHQSSAVLGRSFAVRRLADRQPLWLSQAHAQPSSSARHSRLRTASWSSTGKGEPASCEGWRPCKPSSLPILCTLHADGKFFARSHFNRESIIVARTPGREGTVADVAGPNLLLDQISTSILGELACFRLAPICLEADHFLPPRSVSVVPGHAPKVFVPYQNILTGPSTPSTSSSPPASPPAHATRHVFVSAAVTSLQDGYVELDRDLLEHERDLDGDEQEVDRLTAELEQAQLEADGRREKRQAPRRLKWDYLIYVSSHRGYEPLLLERVLTRSSAGAWLHPAASTRIRGTNEGGRSYFPRGVSFGNERLRADRLSSRASPRRPSGKRSTAPTRS